MARRLGADVTIDFSEDRPDRRDHAADRAAAASTSRSRRSARSKPSRAACACCKPGGVLSSLGVYSGKLTLPLDAFAAGLGDHTIVTTLCPGGKERMRRLMNVVAAGRVDLEAAGHASLHARSDRGSVRAVRESARRRAQGRDHALSAGAAWFLRFENRFLAVGIGRRVVCSLRGSALRVQALVMVGNRILDRLEVGEGRHVRQAGHEAFFDLFEKIVAALHHGQRNRGLLGVSGGQVVVAEDTLSR